MTNSTQIINYPSSTVHAVYGMLSARNYIMEIKENSSYYPIRKHKSKAVLFPKNNNINITFEDVYDFMRNNEEIKRLSLQYLLKGNFDLLKSSLGGRGIKYSKFNSNLLLSKLDENFFLHKGKKYKEIREVDNSFDKYFYYKVNEPLENIKDGIEHLISWWDENCGAKYGWQKHSGYDKSFFNNWYEKNKKNLLCLTFYEKETENLIGYSVVSKNILNTALDEKEYKHVTYLIRKCKTIKRNTTLSLDFQTFKWLKENLLETDNILINWGASSGGVLQYKRTKFPIGLEEKVFFMSLHRKDIINEK